MTDSDIPWGDSPPADLSFATARPRRHRHVWKLITHRSKVNWGPSEEQPDGSSMMWGKIDLATTEPLNDPYWVCDRCHRRRDDGRSRRGRSSRRLGNDQERRAEKVYGWRKVGEFGGPDDLLGEFAIVQQKSSRRAAPKSWRDIFAALDIRAAGRVPLILLSFVRHGVATEDYIILRGSDWLALHGRDE